MAHHNIFFTISKNKNQFFSKIYFILLKTRNKYIISYYHYMRIILHAKKVEINHLFLEIVFYFWFTRVNWKKVTKTIMYLLVKTKMHLENKNANTKKLWILFIVAIPFRFNHTANTTPNSVVLHNFILIKQYIKIL